MNPDDARLGTTATGVAFSTISAKLPTAVASCVLPPTERTNGAAEATADEVTNGWSSNYRFGRVRGLTVWSQGPLQAAPASPREKDEVQAILLQLEGTHDG